MTRNARIAMLLTAARAALSQPKVYPVDKSYAFRLITQARKARLGL